MFVLLLIKNKIVMKAKKLKLSQKEIQRLKEMDQRISERIDDLETNPVKCWVCYGRDWEVVCSHNELVYPGMGKK